MFAVDPTEHTALARWYARKFRPSPGCDFDDLEAAALEGVVEAARRFDPARGIKFSTYATWWMRKSVQRALRLGEAVVVPQHAYDHDVTNFRYGLQRDVDVEMARRLPVSFANVVSTSDGDGVTIEGALTDADKLWLSIATDDCEGPACRALDALTLSDPQVGEVTADYILGAQSYVETARRFGISPGRVRTLVKRGLEQLRDVVAEPDSVLVTTPSPTV